MYNLFKIEIFSFIAGFKELIYSLAEKLDFRMKSFKTTMRGNLIEKELDLAFIRLGKKALPFYSIKNGTAQINPELFQQELREIQTLNDNYSLTLQELSNLQRQALKESLSHCTEQFQRSGWELAQIAVPEHTTFAKLKIKEIPFKRDLLILMIKKENKMELVHGDTLLEGGDALICIGTSKSLQDFKTFLHQKDSYSSV